MANKQNTATWKEINDIEFERSSYLIKSDELIFETLGETIGDESGSFIKQLHMASTRQYKCPACKHAISITSTDFIQGIAMASCDDCGRNAFAIDDVLFNR